MQLRDLHLICARPGGPGASWAIASQHTHGDLTGSGKGSGLVDISKMRR
ncbi:unnamed protein product [Penicillium camemberti]|uniref:Str. FM013 n=1 Tax=Penicillium camemberti (strain FM 013) TaxID=1429867 RepID=A0A0G4P4D9_PENC3|nr:unnamed protein product [Penicillium camemberti]